MYLPQVTVLGDREPPTKISKQPRGMYSSQGELNPTQSLPRWPYESQVNIQKPFIAQKHFLSSINLLRDMISKIDFEHRTRV